MPQGEMRNGGAAPNQAHPEQFSHEDYTIGWICGVPKERIASSAMLDSIHPDLPRKSNDHNSYSLGRVGRHNVVVACGLSNANSGDVAAQMMCTFPSIKFGLLVGIGGGVPKFVRLGDVVVNVPADGYAGLVQWRFDDESGVFTRTGSLKRPPTELLAALTKLEADHAMKGSKIPQYLNEVERNWPKLVPRYTKLNSYQDILFRADYNHVEKLSISDISITYNGADDAKYESKEDQEDEQKESHCMHCDRSKIVLREPRDMLVHHGLVASSFQAIKSAGLRDEVNKRLGGQVYCIETEAAGMFSEFPCAVIRGISDYADSHKSREGQEYAAMVAAAFAKELLSVISVEDVMQMPSAKGFLAPHRNRDEVPKFIKESSIHQPSHQPSPPLSIQKLSRQTSPQLSIQQPSHQPSPQLSIQQPSHQSSPQLNIQQPSHQTSPQLSLQQTSHQLNPQLSMQQPHQDAQEVLNWLSPTRNCPQPRDYLMMQHPGTGLWFLKSSKYRAWLKGHKQNLFCPGIPGVGKTTLTSAVIDNLESRFKHDPAIGIAYVYCNPLQKNTQKADSLLESVLKQLARRRPTPPESVKSLYDQHKGKPTQPSLDEVAKALHFLITDFSKVFLIVDALDECPDGCRARFLSVIFSLQLKIPINLFATSRPRIEIGKEFYGRSDVIEISARREDLEKYVDAYIPRLLLLSDHNHDLSVETRERFRLKVKTAIIDATGGIFLLAKLYLGQLIDKTTLDDLNEALARLPKGEGSLTRAYDNAVQRIRTQTKGHRLLAERALSLLTCAKRHLTTLELREALAVRGDTLVLDENKRESTVVILAACGNLVTADQHGGTIRLIHETTREYLATHMFSIKPSGGPMLLIEDPSALDIRKNDEAFVDAQRSLTATCVTYLSYNKFERGYCQTDQEFEERLRSNPFYNYAAHYWGHHASEVPLFMDEVSNFFQKKKHVEAAGQALLAERLWPNQVDYSQEAPRQLTGLHLVAYFGIEKQIKTERIIKMVPSDMKLESRDNFGRIPLTYAAQNGHAEVVKLLLKRGAEVESRDNSDRTPLSWAVQNGHEGIVQLLLKKGASIESKDHIGMTPLFWASQYNHTAIAQVLLDKGANIESRVYHSGQTPLSQAAKKGYKSMVRLLLDRGAVIDAKSRNGRTPLFWATWYGHLDVVQLLMERGADIEAKQRAEKLRRFSQTSS